ncbi:MAG: hypothetical protein H7A25_14645 [Leptospiraceae bacterium]|nr:hypothetical protein [Leptospiraceae bacterium]MCP5501142.1 hypothetical protein [Leptospiraceae bacterium]
MQSLPIIRKRQTLFIWSVIGLAYLFIWSTPFFTRYTGKGIGTIEAENILRDYKQFKWYVIPLLLIVLNAYFDEIRKKNWSTILAGLAFFLMDVFNEIWNGLFHTATGKFAAVWMCAYPTAYQPLMGWNLEIIFMFLLMGLASTKALPENKYALVFGKINNRHFTAFIMAWLCVFVEMILNSIGALQWNYLWWQINFPWLIFLTGYLPFWEIAYLVYDLEETKHQIYIVSAMATFGIIAFVVFLSLGWI